MTATALHHRLVELGAERAAASLAGLDADAAYIGELRAEIEATRASLVGAAVIEIASFRGALDGPQVG